LLASMSLLRASGSFDVIPATGDKHNPNYDAQKQKRDISELGQLWKHHGLLYGCHEPQDLEQKRFFGRLE
jgi:hypothetical protein